LNEQRKREISDLRQQLDKTVDPHQYHKLEKDLRVKTEQYEQAKKELDTMRKTRDLYASELKRESKQHFDELDKKVRESLRINDPSVMASMANAILQAGNSNSSRDTRGDGPNNNADPYKNYYQH